MEQLCQNRSHRQCRDHLIETWDDPLATAGGKIHQSYLQLRFSSVAHMPLRRFIYGR